jgi:Na+-translocating ferredoxin:NAD+ oxidoreductase RnfD subunit
VRHKITMSGLLALCGLALLVQHVAERGRNDTGDHLVAGALMLMAAVIVWFLPAQTEGD